MHFGLVRRQDYGCLGWLDIHHQSTALGRIGNEAARETLGAHWSCTLEEVAAARSG